jgi:hypothetical protein
MIERLEADLGLYKALVAGDFKEMVIRKRLHEFMKSHMIRIYSTHADLLFSRISMFKQ